MLNYFKRVIAKSKTNSSTAKNSLSSVSLSKATESGPRLFTSKPAQLIAASALDIGRRRENNEDALLSITSTLAVDSENIAFAPTTLPSYNFKMLITIANTEVLP